MATFGALWLAHQGKEATFVEIIGGVPVQNMNRLMMVNLTLPA